MMHSPSGLLVERSGRDPTFSTGIKRELLAKVMSDVGTGEDLLAKLDLIDDRSPRAIPQGHGSTSKQPSCNDIAATAAKLEPTPHQADSSPGL